MADTGTNKQKSQESSQSGGPQGMQRGSQGGPQGMQRRGSFLPSIFSMTPRDFFTMSPFTMMRRLAEDMDRAFAGVGGAARTSSEEEVGWMPNVEVRHSGNNLVVCADLPGLSENDVKVEATEEGLVIEGERKREYSGEEGGIQRSERSYGHFWRMIPLPEDANLEQAKANFKNGVLEVTIPVPEAEKKRRQIPISGSTSEQGQGGKARSAGA